MMATRLIRMGHRLGIGRRNYSCLVFASEHHARDEWVARRVAQCIDVLAYAHINVDNRWREGYCGVAWDDQGIPEHDTVAAKSPVRDHQSSGALELCVRIVSGQLRAQVVSSFVSVP